MTSGASAERVSDGALIERVIGGEESALAALYDRYSGMLHSMLVRILRDTQTAEEILQDVFFHLWNNAAKFDSARGSLPGWLLVSARNRAISRCPSIWNPASHSSSCSERSGARSRICPRASGKPLSSLILKA
ncbi:MAG: sigma factor [Candidatus Acidiferrales bacterium]